MNLFAVFLASVPVLFITQINNTQINASARQPVVVPAPQVVQQSRKTGGEPAKKLPIVELDFEGNVTFPTHELLKELRSCLGYSPEQSLLYHEERFEYCTRFKINNYMRSRGYLRAALKEPKVREAGGGLRITLRVEEGARYRLGRVKVDGAKVFTQEQVVAMLGLQPGEVVEGEKLFKGLHEHLKKEYAEKGYVQYDFDLAPTFSEFADSMGDALVDFSIKISEGPSYKIQKIEFAGNTTVSSDVLWPEMLLKEGEPFNRTLFEESIRRLNGLGLFEPIDEHHVEFRTNNEEGLLSVRIKLTEKGPR